jgi:ABC-type molybdate transport system substrate-binding protein
MIQALILVIPVGVQPLDLLNVSAQGTGWECQPSVVVDPTPVGTPVAVEQDAVAFPADGGNLTVFAAASLTDAFEAIEQELEAATSNLSITYNFGGSQALVTQLEEGAQSEEEDVRDVLAKVALGELNAGIVYVSDTVAAGDQVHVVDIPDETNVIATYPVAVLAEGDQALGSAFVAYLISEEGQRLLERYGIQPVG